MISLSIKNMFSEFTKGFSSYFDFPPMWQQFEVGLWVIAHVIALWTGEWSLPKKQPRSPSKLEKKICEYSVFDLDPCEKGLFKKGKITSLTVPALDSSSFSHGYL